jgi:hypothetical protein
MVIARVPEVCELVEMLLAVDRWAVRSCKLLSIKVKKPDEAGEAI